MKINRNLALTICFIVGALAMTLPDVGQPRKNEYADMAIYYSLTGWVEEAPSRTWTFVSASAPVFVLSVDDDVTGFISANMKIRAKQDAGTYLYGYILKVELSGANTLITVFGGTDYAFAAENITEVAISNVRAPYGFPLNRDIWSIVMEDSTDRTTTTIASVVQLDATHEITLPPGAWLVEAHAYFGNNSTTNININFGFSESTSAFSNADWIRGWQTTATGAVTPVSGNIDVPAQYVEVTTNTPLYLVASLASGACTWGYYPTGYAKTILRAVFANL